MTRFLIPQQPLTGCAEKAVHYWPQWNNESHYLPIRPPVWRTGTVLALLVKTQFPTVFFGFGPWWPAGRKTKLSLEPCFWWRLSVVHDSPRWNLPVIPLAHCNRISALTCLGLGIWLVPVNLNGHFDLLGPWLLLLLLDSAGRSWWLNPTPLEVRDCFPWRVNLGWITSGLYHFEYILRMGRANLCGQATWGPNCTGV